MRMNFFKIYLLFVGLMFSKCLLSQEQNLRTGSKRDVIFFLRKNGKWGAYSSSKGMIVQPNYDSITRLTTNLIKVKKNDKWGLAIIGSNNVQEIKYSFISKFHQGYAICSIKKFIGNYDHVHFGLIDSTGNEVIQPIYSTIQRENDHCLMRVCQPSIDLFGCLEQYDSDGRPDTRRYYDLASENCNLKANSAIFKQINLHTLKENIITNVFNVEYMFDQLRVWKCAQLRSNVNLTGRFQCGVSNLQGKSIIQNQYDYILRVYGEGNDKYIVSSKSRYGVINSKGTVLIPVKYSSIYQPYVDTAGSSRMKALLIVESGGKSGVMTTSGKYVIPLEHDYITYRDGFFEASKNSSSFNRSLFSKAGKLLFRNSQYIIRDYGLVENDNVVYDIDGTAIRRNVSYVRGFDRKNYFWEEDFTGVSRLLDRNFYYLRDIPKALPKGEIKFVLPNYGIVGRDSLMGLFSLEGKMTSDVKYNSIYFSIYSDQESILVRVGKYWQIISQNEISGDNYKFDEIAQFNGKYVLASINSNWYIYDTHEGKIKSLGEMEPVYLDGAEIYSNHGMRTFNTTGMEMMMKGELFMDEISENIAGHSFSQYGIYVAKEKKVGLLDFQLNKIIDFNLDGFTPFLDSYSLIKRGSKWGVINSNLAEELPVEFDQIAYSF